VALTITVAQLKGGAGKTTLAAHLAVEGARRGFAVGLIDADPQGSLSGWAAERERRLGAPDMRFADGAGYRLTGEVRSLARDCDLVVVDTPPQTDGVVKSAVRVADLVLAPLQPSPLDLAASLPVARLFEKSGVGAVFVFNRTPARSRVANLIRAEFEATGLPLAAAALGQRAAFCEALLTGRGAQELDRNSLAASEIAGLFSEIVPDATAAAA